MDLGWAQASQKEKSVLVFFNYLVISSLITQFRYILCRKFQALLVLRMVNSLLPNSKQIAKKLCSGEFLFRKTNFVCLCCHFRSEN